MEYCVTVLSLLTVFTVSEPHVASAAGGVIENQYAYFTGLKSDSVFFCATSSPNKTLTARSKLECTVTCQQLNHQPACCTGVNYRQQNNRCDIFFNNPTTYSNSTAGCQYIQRQGSGCLPVLVQQHYNGSKFFHRTWQEFKVGFGSITGDYWIGNELLHLLTKGGGCRLRVDVQLQTGLSWQWAEYNTFIVDDESSGYTLHIGDFNGTAYNSFLNTAISENINGMKFCTYDSDNNIRCASMYAGGFWYNNCGCVHINSHDGSFKWYFYGGALQASRVTLLSRH